MPRHAGVEQAQPHDVAAALEELVGDAGVAVLAAVVVAGEIARRTVDVLEQHEQRVGRALGLDLVLARGRRLDGEIDLLAGREVEYGGLERAQRCPRRLQRRAAPDRPHAFWARTAIAPREGSCMLSGASAPD